MISLRMRRFVAATLPFLVARSWLAGVELEPIGPGGFVVASTNIEVTPRAGVPIVDYLNGKVTAKEAVYLTDILTHPESVPTLHISVPSDAKLFGAQAGTGIPLVLFILYPGQHGG